MQKIIQVVDAEEKFEIDSAVGTHGGEFHHDEMLSIVLLSFLFKPLYVLRTRNLKLQQAKVSLLIDIGGGAFDHHQTGGNDGCLPIEKRAHRASAGLIWEKFGHAILEKYYISHTSKDSDKKTDEIYKQIDEDVIQYVDAEDNGQFMHIHPFMFGRAFLPFYKDAQIDYDKGFEDGVNCFRYVLEKIFDYYFGKYNKEEMEDLTPAELINILTSGISSGNKELDEGALKDFVLGALGKEQKYMMDAIYEQLICDLKRDISLIGLGDYNNYLSGLCEAMKYDNSLLINASNLDVYRVIFENIIHRYAARCISVNEINSLINSESRIGNVLLIPNPAIEWVEPICEYNGRNSLNRICFVAYEHPDDHMWAVRCVPKSINKPFTKQIEFPRDWGGKTKEELRLISGVRTALMCHPGLFFAKAESLEDAIILCEKATEEKQIQANIEYYEEMTDLYHGSCGRTR